LSFFFVSQALVFCQSAIYSMADYSNHNRGLEDEEDEEDIDETVLHLPSTV